VGSVFGPVRFLLPVWRLSWFLYTLNIYAHFSSHKNQQSRQTESRNLMDPKTLPTIWGTYMKLVTKYQISAVQYIFHRIFLSNCWWQKSDIWSQTSYRYTILWVAFLDPSDSYFLVADLVGIWRVKKQFPRYGIPISSLWPNFRFLPSIVAEKNVTKNGHIQNVCSLAHSSSCFIIEL
jgi:hypothetical protein